MGYDPVWQDVEPTEGGELLDVLRRRVAASDLLLQLVGDRYGAEPPTATDDFGRLSYTQFEARYAESIGRQAIYCFVSSEFAADESPPESEEKQSLQAKYREWLSETNRLRYENISSPQELELSVRRISNELHRLRQDSERRARRQRAATSFSLIALVILFIAGWYAYKAIRSSQEYQLAATTRATANAEQLRSEAAVIRESIEAIVPRLVSGFADKDRETDSLRKQLEGAVRRLAESETSSHSTVRTKLQQLRASGNAKFLGQFLDEQMAKQPHPSIEQLRERAAVAMVTGDLDRAGQCLGGILSVQKNDLDAIYSLGWVYEKRSELLKAEREYERLFELAPADSSWQAAARFALGDIAFYRRGDLASADRLFREARDIYAKCGQQERQADVLGNLFLLATSQQNFDEAARHARESAEIYHKLGLPSQEGNALSHMGVAALARNDLIEADKRLREAMEIFRKLGDLGSQATTLGNLGLVANERGDFVVARQLWAESRDLFTRVGNSAMARQRQRQIDKTPIK